MEDGNLLLRKLPRVHVFNDRRLVSENRGDTKLCTSLITAGLERSLIERLESIVFFSREVPCHLLFSNLHHAAK
jgi:hypothetical protein